MNFVVFRIIFPNPHILKVQTERRKAQMKPVNKHPEILSGNKNAIKKESETIQNPDFPDSYFSRSICSSTDCTGLIPALPSSEEELEAYEEMYAFCSKPVKRHS